MRRSRPGMLLVLLLAVLLSGFGQVLGAGRAMAAAPSWIKVEARIDGNQVVVRSVLYDSGSQPIVGRPLTIEGLGPAGSSVTGQDGWSEARLAVPTDQKPGRVTIRVKFAGDSQFDPSEGTGEVEFKEDNSTRISAKVAGDTKVYPGDTITVDGSLVYATGDPIAGGTVTTAVGEGEPENPVITNADGRFTTMAHIPQNAPPGPVSLVISFAGTSQLDASRTEIQLTVEKEPSKPTESEETPAAEPTQEASPAEEDTPEAPTAAQQPQATPRNDGPSATGLILLASCVTVLGIGGLVVALTLRARHRKDEDNADLIEEAPLVSAPQYLHPQAPAPTDTAVLDVGDQPTELIADPLLEDTQEMAWDEDEDEPPRPPRRAAD